MLSTQFQNRPLGLCRKKHNCRNPLVQLYAVQVGWCHHTAPELFHLNELNIFLFRSLNIPNAPFVPREPLMEKESIITKNHGWITGGGTNPSGSVSGVIFGH